LRGFSHYPLQTLVLMVNICYDRLAVCGIFKSDGTQVATRFIRGGDSQNGRRKRLLGMVAVKRSLTGTVNKDLKLPFTSFFLSNSLLESQKQGIILY